MANKNLSRSTGGKPSDRRAGQRKDRDQRVGKRVPELGYNSFAKITKDYNNYLLLLFCGLTLIIILYLIL